MMSSSVLFCSCVLVALLALCGGGCEARALFGLDSLFDNAGFSNGTSLLEQFFLTHAQHSLDSLAELAELADIGGTFFSGK